MSSHLHRTLNFSFYCLIMMVRAAPWPESEQMRQVVDAYNKRALEIEMMTKQAAILKNQEMAMSSTPTTIPPPISPPPSPRPSIEDDKTFVARMEEQAHLVNQLNFMAAQEAMSRNNILAAEASLLSAALRPMIPLPIGPPPPPQQIFHFPSASQARIEMEEGPAIVSRPIKTYEALPPPGEQLPLRRDFAPFVKKSQQKNETVEEN
ncbi:unnamed protein product [Caenorhabditis auriculariae]|uniref:Uncharacterized protein n=1 Tax=Caenorhabditis auriculariae TaxID=2777116 RepID=A0A8S1GYL4_9PELO|nr:unnamed protein product [Caenorhabditis auriculariae]